MSCAGALLEVQPEEVHGASSAIHGIAPCIDRTFVE